jgi:hypothetical protein
VDDLIPFTRIRLDELELETLPPGEKIETSGQEYILADIKAKRQAVDGYETARRATQLAVNRHLASGAPSDGDEVVTRLHIRDRWELAAKLAALPFAWHRDYQKEWTP